MSGRMRHMAGGDSPINPSGNLRFVEVLNRRGVLLGAGALAVAASGGAAARTKAQSPPPPLGFKEVPHGLDETDHVPAGYERQILIRWGDPVLKDAPAFDPKALNAAAQEKQFGYNNDFIGYLPLPWGSRDSTHGLLGVNHEYTNPELMFAGLTKASRGDLDGDQTRAVMAAHGFSVIEVRREAGQWKVVPDSKHARRFPMTTAPMRVAGPAAGHARMKTNADPSGTKVIGTLGNCAGGVTPWGTFLSGEENFHFYFNGKPDGTSELANHLRYGVTGNTRYGWGKHVERFNQEKEPNEPNRFGWVVEIDPYDAASVPAKRTAMGRMKHEGATVVVAPNGRVVAYMGDDQADEYVYRFVSAGTFNPKDRAANRDLLDQGTLSVARFDADGSMSWLPLVFGTGPLTAANGFQSQADVVIEARRAADLLGATPMDRAEDMEADPLTGRVFIMCTGNRDRRKTNVANTRAPNLAGHIVELVPPGGEGAKADHTAAKFRWSLFLQAGDPKAKDGASYGKGRDGKGPSDNGWFAWPDNCAFDGQGRIWIATDGLPVSKRLGDGLFVAEILGPDRAVPRRFYRAPTGAEVCGPCFTPDNTTLFLAIQHPGEESFAEESSSFEKPLTRWPDFKDDTPPRPAVIAIVKQGGGTIGG